MGIASGVTNPGSTNYTTSVSWQTNHDSDAGIPPPQYISLHDGPYLILVLFPVKISWKLYFLYPFPGLAA